MRLFRRFNYKRFDPDTRPLEVARYSICVEIDDVVYPFHEAIPAWKFYEGIADGFVGDGAENEHEVTIYVSNKERAKKWIRG